MVDLCELKMMNNKDADYWPMNIDQHVAQLEFDTSSSMMIDQSMYASSTTDDVDVTDPDHNREEEPDKEEEEDEEDEEEDEEEEEEEEEGEEEDKEEEEEDDDDDADVDLNSRLRAEELADVAAMAAAAAAAASIDGSIIISTDSLDMDLIRDCSGNTNNRNEYKLTFEDSGQWTTTSGIGASVTTNSNSSPPMRRVTTATGGSINDKTSTYQPSYGFSSGLSNGRMLDRHFGLRLLEQLNNDAWAEANNDANEEEKHKLINQLLSNIAAEDEESESGQVLDSDRSSGRRPMTTWGRIQNVEPYDAKTYSMQNVYANGTNCADRNALDNSGELIAGAKRPFSCGDVLSLPGAIKQQQMPASLSRRISPSTTLNVSHNSNDSSHSKSTATSSRTSLLANFVEQQNAKQAGDWLRAGCRATDPDAEEENNAYEYNETYLGGGRYMDVNENEIGYVPESTASIQRSDQSSSHSINHSRQNADGVRQLIGRQSSVAGVQKKNAIGPVGRTTINTHIDLPPSFTAPDLKFLSLTHKTPSFCRSQISLDEMLRRARNGSLLLSENLFSDEKVALLADAFCPPATQEQMSLFERTSAQPDSGLGSSSSSGPAHIEDWPSLAVLLPKNVVDACSFFKTNSSLLTGSSASGSMNNIERKISANTLRDGEDYDVGSCRTCFNVRHHRLHPPSWAHKSPNGASLSPIAGGTATSIGKTPLCDCLSCCCCCASIPQTMSEIALTTRRDRSASRYRLSNSASTTTSTTPALVTRIPKLNAAELSVVGLPLYNAKRALVERVVEGVAEIARGASAVVLYSALTRLMADGLLEEYRPWSVIVAVTGNGPATNNIFNLVKRLEASEKPENSRIDHFFRELLSQHSLEGWLSYIVLKENVLTRMYADTAFLLRANNAYRSLFWRLIESIELLFVLSQCSRHRAQRKHNVAVAAVSSSCYSVNDWNGASRLPSDSRIPKSSSIPEELVPNKQTSQTKRHNEKANAQSVGGNKHSELFLNVTPSTSTPVSFVDVTEKRTYATLPRHQLTSTKRRVSRIPIASFTAARSLTHYGTSLSSPSSTLRTRSLHSRGIRTATPTITALVRERISENDAIAGLGGLRLLPLEKGERVRVLSMRGDMSRCCRMHLRFGALLNGVVPTRKLDFC